MRARTAVLTASLAIGGLLACAAPVSGGIACQQKINCNASPIWHYYGKTPAENDIYRCINTTVNFSVSTDQNDNDTCVDDSEICLDGPISYTWSGVTDTHTSTASGSWSSSGTYTVTCTMTDPGNYVKDKTETATWTVRVGQAIWDAHTAISGSITAPANNSGHCLGAEVTCSASASDDDHRHDCATGNDTHPPDTLTYTWSATGGSFKDGVNVGDTVTWIAPQETPGAYTITCTVQDAALIPAGEVGTRDDADLPLSVEVKVIGGDIVPGDPCGDPYGKYLLLTNPVSSSPLEPYRSHLDQPTGTTYKWEISVGQANAHIDGPDTQYFVNLKADAEGDLTLKLTYTYGDCSCEYTLDTAVQKPNQATSSMECGQCYGQICQFLPPLFGVQRDVLYTIRDDAGRPVPHAYWDETWAGTYFPPGGWDGPADCAGRVPDHFQIYEQWPCSGSGNTLASDVQRIKVSGWPSEGWFWGPWTVQVQDLPSGPYLHHSGCD